ncbi:ion channel [Pseudonocardia asaccharolytica]|uniref:ion channel n=1 Tax=Pseudonocardia asaccharolytica TaxID=54010 RepID=UPI0004152149|nr:ion channel [Pseudonocardia asaccharolytica]
MPFFLVRFARLVGARLRGWRLSLAIAAFVFATSWLAMALVEPATNEITHPANYWWWFLVTAATVGYGDFFPETFGGHLVGAYVIVGGIVALTVLFTALASQIQMVKGRRMRGAVEVDLSGHTVLLGYTPGRTEGIVTELCLEGDRDVVLGAWDDVAENPMPEHERVRFVRGDLTSVDVLTRAGVARATTAVIDGRDDNETLTMAVAVDHVNPDVHMVATLRDLNRCEHLRYVNPAVQCVQWHMPKMVTEEALDPGITQVYAELLGGTGTGNTYSTLLPAHLADRPFGECQTHFGREFAATLLAVRTRDRLLVSPRWEVPVPAGSVLYYVAAERIAADRIAASRPAGRPVS